MTASTDSSSSRHVAAVDVLIIGGGLAGGTLACALAQGGLRVAAVDREAPTDQIAPEYDGRCSAIAHSSVAVLKGLGLWEDLAPVACPMDDIRVTDGASSLFLHYDHSDIGDEPFGHMIENRAIRAALGKAMGRQCGVALHAPAAVTALVRTPGGVEATLSDGATVTAALVVGADGRGSETRAHAGIKIMKWSYHQTGIVCTVAHEKPHHNVAHEHFLPAGPFAILPLNGDKTHPHRSSLVWTERESLAPTLLALDDDAFLGELERRFGDFLGALEVVGPRFGYPLTLQQADRSIDTRLCLVGDADHGMHPIAGQGLNMGLRDVAALAEILTDAHRLGLDVGSALVLERYQQWRRFDNTTMLALTDALTKLFSNDVTPIRIARDLGLAAVNAAGPLKKVFMRHAMGTVGRLPRLMRGEAL